METALPNFHFHDLHPELGDFHSDVIAGLSRKTRRLSPKFFYDERGSQLFDAITRLPEYYPTRTEIDLLQRHGEDMAEMLGNDGLLFELGSGSDTKIRVLLDALQPRTYAPIDISREPLRLSAGAIAEDHPELQVHAICTDYSRPLALPGVVAAKQRSAFFPGSSIGNFDPGQACDLLQRIAGIIGPEGRLLIGVDLKKAPSRLHAAYNDSEGVTAQFNLNLLARINRELDADFDLAAFRHEAFYNAQLGRIEMHLVATAPQRVRIDGCCFEFQAGESIHTENSYKFSVEEFQALAAQAGLASLRVWQDDDALFSVHCLQPV
ncbi:L-histidine N(alpha)-methyltransferase [Thiobacillus thioparus]|uniref:L-histidine N(alpha)-methyltransferase n=1 Tax=Thiobacillus thioparus TaxID=931 RepID=UPI000365ED80|nr:L-histidine N(alpha)-methyltransferase [Thiobacillus thioparus]